MVAGIRGFVKARKARTGLSSANPISPRQFSHLFPHHEHYEAIRNNWGSWTGIVGRGSRPGSELRRHHEHVVGFGIERQRARTFLRGYVLGNGEFVLRFLLDDGE